ncbi:MFS transporter [Zavarzinia sp. CC-PAN008]|uniref:MFS transporter n=1 Tax=Zavarzinia sp. CC-PAN008 TaxID=3243332 RepID=UPI003F7458E2
MTEPVQAHQPPAEGAALAPLRHRVFLALWLATVVSNVGTWMQNAAAGWLMTGLTQDAFIVSLVQVATMLPVVLLGLPAGALADIMDRRRLLVVINLGLTAVVAVLGVIVWLDQVTPGILLAFTFLVGVGSALVAPSWQAVVPQLVPRQDLQAAISLNSVGINISRALGPALAGVIIGTLGLAAPFWFNAVSTLGVVAVLLWWRPAPAGSRDLPAERFHSALRVGWRHARHNRHLMATLVRAAGFFLFASAYWALLPLVARDQIASGPQVYGLLLGTIGVGAVGGAFLLPVLKAKLGPDRLVAAATIGTALALVLFGVAHAAWVGLIASLVAGVAWIAVLAPINVSAQVALPDWVKGRGLALFAMTQFGAMTLGSALWGQVAELTSLTVAHLAAAAGAVVAIPLLARWHLHTGAAVDMTPSMHWPAPVVSAEVAQDRGPVRISVEYRIAAADHDAFLAAIAEFRTERLRDGAYDWQLFEDAENGGTLVETFLVPSWLEHLRQHHRVTGADRDVQARVARFHQGPTPPLVRHMIALRPPKDPT